MKIIIGREEGARRLHCRVDGRDFYVGQAGSVPLSVSRQHCILTIEGSHITIENAKMQNETFVDGNQVFHKDISPTSQVQLGVERYTIPLQQILSLAMGNPHAPQAPVRTFSLQPLESIWADYDQRRMQIQDNASKNANQSRLQGILSLSGMCIGFIPGIDQSIRVLIIIAALGTAVYFFLKGQMGESMQKQLHDLDDEFATKYKCPNPHCGRPFGAIPYRQIKFTQRCFACGCAYTH